MHSEYTPKRPESLIVEDADGILTVTLNRPDVHNAFDEILIDDLHRLFRSLSDRADLLAVVLTGAGESFSAGADLNWMKRAADHTQHANFEDAMRLSNMMDALYALPMTTIAKVNGTAMGGGLGLCACCDIAVAADPAQFALSEVRLGIIPGVISPYVIQAIGIRESHRWFQTGERFVAAEALRMGLLHAVCAPDALEEAVDAILRELKKGSPDAIRASKTLLREVAGRQLDDTTRRETAQRIAGQRATREGREGLSAFLEKRKPDWIA
ncbi:enoyl-CoA hydratase/isomerase family protein [Nisaea sp.]|uniref:enoyl-CoA hydratase/isomerase family protein n=1 Tax=Nisaea sp. TaxID=2024842 RepID=UPI002B264A9E|nr:enoyl-CoA hydratase/isomerase family protein [Nisaea sp.]